MKNCHAGRIATTPVAEAAKTSGECPFASCGPKSWRLRLRGPAAVLQTEGQGRRACSPRSGISLMEVILATAILLGSVVVLSELAGIGRRQSNRSAELSEAQRLCEWKLNEMLAGIAPIEPVTDAPFEDDTAAVEMEFGEQEESLFGDLDEPDVPHDESLEDEEAEWTYSVEVTPVENVPGLAALTVTVTHNVETLRRPARFSLTRWIPDPDLEDEEGFDSSFDSSSNSLTGGLFSGGRGS